MFTAPRHHSSRRHPRRLVEVFLAALLVTATGAAHAESRQGFIVGGGVGPGFASVSPPDGERQSQLGVTTDMTLGYAPTDQLAIFAMSRIVWFDYEAG